MKMIFRCRGRNVIKVDQTKNTNLNEDRWKYLVGGPLNRLFLSCSLKHLARQATSTRFEPRASLLRDTAQHLNQSSSDILETRAQVDKWPESIRLDNNRVSPVLPLAPHGVTNCPLDADLERCLGKRCSTRAPPQIIVPTTAANAAAQFSIQIDT